MGELQREVLFYREPNVSREVIGKLPAGTVFTFLGDVDNGFAKVRVELEGGQEIEGWILEKNLRTKPAEKGPVEEKTEPNTPKKKAGPLKRGAVPRDEEALLRREPTFQYGIYIGPNLNILSHSAGEGTYNGLGFTGGGFLGFYISKEFIVRGEGAYSVHNGTGSDGILSFGLMDLGLIAEYMIDKVLIFGGLRYDIGVGIGDIPRTVQLGQASELSSAWADFGGGFRFPLNDVASLILRGKYGFSFVRLPVAFQAFAVLTYLEIRG